MLVFKFKVVRMQLSARPAAHARPDGQPHGKETFMKHEYELGFIIPSNVQEADTRVVIDAVRAWIEGFGGEVTDVDYWGRRRLAYPIDDFREGYYAFLKMNYPAERISELEYNLRLSDQVIRHLVIRLDED
jgi:small subunit ribosomal protein S6